MSFGPRALQPVLVRPVRVEEHAEEQDVFQTVAPRPPFDGDVAIHPCLLRPIVVPLADSLDLEHNARNVPGERWKDAIVSLVAIRCGYALVSLLHETRGRRGSHDLRSR